MDQKRNENPGVTNVEDLKLWLKAFSQRKPPIRYVTNPRMSGESWLLRDPLKSGLDKDLIKVFCDEEGLPIMTDEIREVLKKYAGI
jgi:hypothetical protein